MPEPELENVDPKQNLAPQPDIKQKIIESKARGVSWVDRAQGGSLTTVSGRNLVCTC